jgi:hypothetical protein
MACPREPGGQHPADGHRAQLVERHREQGHESDRDRGAREDHGPASIAGGVACRVVRRPAGGARLSKATHREERVVDAKAEADHRHEALEHDGERPRRADYRRRTQGEGDHQGSGDHWDGSGDERTEGRE